MLIKILVYQLPDIQPHWLPNAFLVGNCKKVGGCKLIFQLPGALRAGEELPNHIGALEVISVMNQASVWASQASPHSALIFTHSHPRSQLGKGVTSCSAASERSTSLNFGCRAFEARLELTRASQI